MRQANHSRVRKLLRENPEGMTNRELAGELNSRPSLMWRALTTMPDAYIDRWETTGKRLAAVWCVVVPPPHCPHPNGRPLPGSDRIPATD